MLRNLFRRPTLAGVAYLLLNSHSNVLALSLREEALGYRSQGYEAQRRGDEAGALAFYQKAAALDPSYAVAHNDVGVLLERQGRLEEAGRSYRQALTLEPDYLEAHMNLAMLYERLGNTDQAITHWLKSYQSGDPHDPRTARAHKRLVALGVLKASDMKGALTGRQQLAGQELQAHAQSREEFRMLTEEHADWP